MSGGDREEEWRRSLAQADGFASGGATDEAVARALSVVRATTHSLGRGDAVQRAMVERYLERSKAALARFRELHTAARERTAARSRAYYARERAVTAAAPSERARRERTVS